MNSQTPEQRKQSEELLVRFLRDRNLREPDGRPLYQYRCSATEIDEIQKQLAVVFPRESTAAVRHAHTCALFCLYGAEWWRRNYSGGPWRWHEILAILGASDPSPQRRAAIVERGLALWARRVLYQSDYREFLGTLAIEGGLPLNFVRNDSGKLRSFFRAVLRDLQLYSQSSKTPSEIAFLHADILPKTLRQDLVYELSGSLALEVRKLQNQVPLGQEPVKYLNVNLPGWREHLPLVLEDDTANAFLNGLVQDAASLALMESDRIRVQRLIRKAGDRISMMAAVQIPTRVSLHKLCALFGTSEFESEPRFELVLESADREEVVLAWATPVRYEGELYYSFDVRQTCVFYADGELPVRLIAQIGTRRWRATDLPGGEALTELPWIFASDTAQSAEFVLTRQGSARIKGETGMVAISEDVEYTLAEGGMLEQWGKIVGMDRNLFKLSGTLTVPDTGGANSRISTGSDSCDDSQYSLSGKRFPFAPATRLQFLGLPILSVCDASALVKHIPSHKLQWCRKGSRTWVPLNDDALGDGTIRFIERDEVRFRQSLTILPTDLSLSFGRDAGLQSGTIYMEGLGVAEVGTDYPGVTLQQEEEDGVCKVAVSSFGEPPSDLGMGIRWQTGAQALVTVPFPSKGAKFIANSGIVLPKGCRVLFDRLGTVRASGLTLGLVDSYTLRGRLLPSNNDRRETDQFSYPFPINGDSEHQTLELSAVRDSIKLLLSSSTRLDAFVELRIEAPGAKDYPQIRVTRYDLLVYSDEEKRHLNLKSDDDASIPGAHLTTQLEVEMRPVWNPEIAPVGLRLNENGTWEIPQDLEVGPWLVTGREGNLYRVRPVIIPIKPESPSAINVEHELEATLRITSTNERKRNLRSLLEKFILDHRNSRYAAISEHIEAFKHLSPTVLDIMVALSQMPEAAILALCQQGRVMPECWAQFEQLPFSWFLVPVKAWLSAFARERRRYEALLSEVPNPGQMISEMKRSILACIPSNPPCWELRRALAESGWEGDLLKNKEFKLASMESTWDFFESSLKDAQQSLFHRQSGKHFPQSIVIEEFGRSIVSNYPAIAPWLKIIGGVRFRWSVLCAPIAAAVIAVYEAPFTEAHLADIRMLRAFDSEFFDEAYRVILTRLIGDRLRSEPQCLKVQEHAES